MSQTEEGVPAEVQAPAETQAPAGVQGDWLAALADGSRRLAMSRRYLLRALDETWIRAVEEALPVLDTVIRHPQRQLREKEKVLPIEFSRNITSRSVRHLTQHTNLIAKVEGDIITPSKILNVYSDETAKTYENKFVNTLLRRLYTFVERRCDTVLERGLDAAVTTLEFGDDFQVGDARGRVHLTLEYEEKPGDGLAMRTDARYTDLWQRAQYIRSVTAAYLRSDFVQAVGQNYVRPPVIRTNAILKNKDLRQCLALWEFLDGYEGAGYTLLIDRQEGDLPAGAEAELLTGVSALYARFLSDMRAVSFAAAGETSPEAPAEPTAAEQTAEQTGETPDGELRAQILREVQIALAADEQYRPAEKTEEESEETLFGRFRFRWSFLARLSQTNDATRGYYAAVKGALLSYRRVNARISWNYETFTYGRRRCARIAVHGKTLLLFLALPPDAYDRDRYHFTDASDTAAYRDVPLRLPIRSARALKYALELIGEVMSRVGATLLPEGKRRTEGLLPPFRSLRELLADRLIRPLAGAALPEETEDGETPAEDNAPVAGAAADGAPEETRADGAAVPDGETAPDADAEDDGSAAETETETETEAEPDGRPLPMRSPYRYSFEARLSLGDETMRARYTALAGALTAYAGVRRRATWHYDAFYHGRGTCARIGVRGKTVSLYLALEPGDYPQSKYHFSDVSGVSLYRGTPMQLRVRSDRALRLACELIRVMLEGRGAQPLAPGRRRAEPLAVAPATREELLAAGLIRLDGEAPAPTGEAELLPAAATQAVAATTGENETAATTETAEATEEVAADPTETPETADTEPVGEAADHTDAADKTSETAAGAAPETAEAEGDEAADETTETADAAVIADDAPADTPADGQGAEPSASVDTPTGAQDAAPAAEPSREELPAPAGRGGFFRRLFSRRGRGGKKPR